MNPQFDYCIVCDGVREEIHGKLIILGFLGICPLVEVGIPYLEQPASLVFCLLGPRGNGIVSVQFELFDDQSNRAIASTVPLPVDTTLGPKTTAVIQLVAVFNHAGPFSLRAKTENSEVFRAQFRIVQGARA